MSGTAKMFCRNLPSRYPRCSQVRRLGRATLRRCRSMRTIDSWSFRSYVNDMVERAYVLVGSDGVIG